MAVIGYDVVARMGEAVRRMFGQEEIVPPGVILFNDRREGHFPQGIRWWTTGQISIAANAAAVGQLEVLNPVGSNLLVVVTKVHVVGPVLNDLFELRLDPAAAAGAVQNTALDTRSPSTSVGSQNRISNTQAGPSGAKVDEVQCAVANQTVTFDFEPVILVPGHRLAVFCDTVNRAMTAVFYGYEYVPRAEEFAA